MNNSIRFHFPKPSSNYQNYVRILWLAYFRVYTKGGKQQDGCVPPLWKRTCRDPWKPTWGAGGFFRSDGGFSTSSVHLGVEVGSHGIPIWSPGGNGLMLSNTRDPCVSSILWVLCDLVLSMRFLNLKKNNMHLESAIPKFPIGPRKMQKSKTKQNATNYGIKHPKKHNALAFLLHFLFFCSFLEFAVEILNVLVQTVGVYIIYDIRYLVFEVWYIKYDISMHLSDYDGFNPPFCTKPFNFRCSVFPCC